MNPLVSECIEKYLKGIMQAENVPFGRPHDLCLLLDACLSKHSEWHTFRADFTMLTQYAVAFRYPGESATKDEARQSVGAAGRLREVFRSVLKLDD